MDSGYPSDVKLPFERSSKVTHKTLYFTHGTIVRSQILTFTLFLIGQLRNITPESYTSLWTTKPNI